MEGAAWTFERKSARQIAQDPVEAEFFRGTEGSDLEFTDPLIREALQNSLDARDRDHPGRPVEVRFSIHREGTAQDLSQVAPWLNGLDPHLRALGSPAVSSGSWPQRIEFLTVEDFGTRGLHGDIRLCSDPTDGSRQDFWWFWRNVGRSGKSDDQRGRWGLGKTVFQASSLAHTILGLTVRSDDQKAYLMGQCVARTHDLTDSAGTRQTHVPHGFFALPHDAPGVGPDDPQIPLSDRSTITRFVRDFDLARGQRPGLSIVIMFPVEQITSDGLITSAISHFFLPIQKNELVVRIRDERGIETTIDSASVEEVADRRKWRVSGRGPRELHVRPPFSLVNRLMNDGDPTIQINARQPGGKTPELTKTKIAPIDLETLRTRFREAKPFSVRVFMDVIHEKRGLQDTWFDIHLEPDPRLTRGEDHFVRGGMKIGGIETLGHFPGWRGLLVVEHSELSGLLGDVEGPAHNDWSQSSGKRVADRNWKKWNHRVGFVKNAMLKLLNLLDEDEENVDLEAFADLFQLPEPDESGARKSRKRNERTQGDEDEPNKNAEPEPDVHIDGSEQPFELGRVDGGFHVRCNGNSRPLRIRIRAAYDQDSGNPWRAWSSLDFTFDTTTTTHTNPLQTTLHACRILEQDGNTLVIEADPGATLQVTGFNPAMDLLVKAESTELADEIGDES